MFGDCVFISTCKTNSTSIIKIILQKRIENNKNNFAGINCGEIYDGKY